MNKFLSDLMESRKVAAITLKNDQYLNVTDDTFELVAIN